MGPDLELDDLSSRVLDIVEQVPAGSVVTYGDIAKQCGTGPRQIGRIMATVGQLVPWWRVVRSDGTSAVAHKAREHWAAEGIGYRESGDSWKVDLKAHRLGNL
ncbi:MGMT family protein [Corynebacterium sp. A21]|uniref:MGMT family protein n=1 Tax=Corynebacterium sp. A21 TaxID=3457318 RepID=UPI003FD54A34